MQLKCRFEGPETVLFTAEPPKTQQIVVLHRRLEFEWVLWRRIRPNLLSKTWWFGVWFVFVVPPNVFDPNNVGQLDGMV